MKFSSQWFVYGKRLEILYYMFAQRAILWPGFSLWRSLGKPSTSLAA
jgi:hypothetical protein